MNEAQTRLNFIDPALREAGWGVFEGSYIRVEFPITDGRKVGNGRRGSKLSADCIRIQEKEKCGYRSQGKRQVYY